MMFDQLRNRYWLRGEVILKSALHIGAGVAEEEIDMPIVRNGKNQAYIPGSSLRGALRSLVERTMATVAPGASCILFWDEADGSCDPFCPSAHKTAADEIRKMIEEGKTDDALKILFGTEGRAGRLCRTCRLFGSPFAASKLKIFDLPIAKPVDERFIRHGVGIDRDQGNAREKIKFEYEVLEASSELKFQFEMVAENLDRLGDARVGADFALLGLVFRMAGKHLTLGGKSGSGLGNCRLELQKVRYFDNATEHGVRKFLTAEEDDGYADMPPSDFLKLAAGELAAYLTPLEAANA